MENVRDELKRIPPEKHNDELIEKVAKERITHSQAIGEIRKEHKEELSQKDDTIGEIRQEKVRRVINIRRRES